MSWEELSRAPDLLGPFIQLVRQLFRSHRFDTKLCSAGALLVQGPLSLHQKYSYVTSNLQIPLLLADYQKLIIDFPTSEWESWLHVFKISQVLIKITKRGRDTAKHSGVWTIGHVLPITSTSQKRELSYTWAKETTCILCSGISGRVASGYNTV